MRVKRTQTTRILNANTTMQNGQASCPTCAGLPQESHQASCLSFQEATHTTNNILKPLADHTSIMQGLLQDTIVLAIPKCSRGGGCFSKAKD